MAITEEQRERRKKGIFASDVAKIMTGGGVRVALEKMGELEPEDLSGIESVELGNILEAPVLDAYENQREMKNFIRSPDTMYHPKFEWLGCHLDALADFAQHSRVVEAKAFSAFNRSGWGEAGTDEVPMDRMWQVMAQMAVTGAEYADIPITFVSEKVLAQFLTTRTVPIEIYTVKRDEELIQFMISECEKVWHCIKTGELPKPVNIGDAELIWRKADPSKALIINDDGDHLLYLHDQLGQARKALEKAEDHKKFLEAEIKNAMQDAAELRYNGKVLATWKNDKDSMKFDKDAFELAQPDLYKQFCVPKAGSRKFLFKG